MDSAPPLAKTKPSLLKGLFPLVLFAFLATQDQIVFWYGEVCKPIVLWAFRAIGVFTQDLGLALQIGKLEVPWTRDCAGVNLLLVLLTVFTWMNRNEPQDRAYGIRLALMVPAAVLANVLRVFTLVLYRLFLYPEVETPQFHYFLGFLWLIPFAVLTLPPDSGRTKKALAIELFHISAVMGILAPLLTQTDHLINVGASLLCLLHSRYTGEIRKRDLYKLVIWILGIPFIVWSGIDSLWLPWLLIFPLVIDIPWTVTPKGLLCILASCPLFILLPGALWIGGAGIAFALTEWIKPSALRQDTAHPRLGREGERILTGILLPVLFLPFIASTLVSAPLEDLQPPRHLAMREIKGLGYEVRVEGQPKELGLLWYKAQGTDRHHTLDVCLTYRGIHLSPTHVQGVKTDGKYWYTEIFLVDQEPVRDHKTYLLSTLGFRRDPGVHLILLTSTSRTTAEDFLQEAEVTLDILLAGMAESSDAALPAGPSGI